MKKFLGFTLSLFLLSSGSFAQKLNIGAKVGANLTKVTGQAFKEGYDLGYHVGGFAEVDLNKNWGIQPEVIWNQTNTTRASGTDAIYNNWQQNTKDIKLNYLTIPLLLRYNVAEMLTLNLGPQVGILLNKDESLWANGKQAFKSGDFALVAGASINLKMLRIYGRYNIGLSNINDVDNQDSWKSQQIQLGLGLSL